LFLSPNSIRPYEIPRTETRKSLGLPEDKVILIYAGNIGIPQDPEFINEFTKKLPDNYFMVLIGTGSNFSFEESSKLMVINNFISQEKIDQFLINADFGLIFLSYKFKVPNFPSKILSYLNSNIGIVSFTNNFNDLNPLKFNNFFDTTFFNWYPSISESLLKVRNFNFRLEKRTYSSFIDIFHVSKQISIIKSRIKN
jgi:hypothetical protein